MPSVASFMMPAAKCVTAMPEDKLSSVVASLVNEKIGCVVVVDPASERAVGIVTKQDVNRMFLNQVRTAVLVVTDTERQRDAAAPRGLRAVCFPPDGSDVPDTPTETPACVGRGIKLRVGASEASAHHKRLRVKTSVTFPRLLTCNDTSAFRLVVLHADPPGDAREGRDEHNLVPRDARDEPGRGCRDSAEAQDPPRRRAERVREIRRDLLVVGHREGVRARRQGNQRPRRTVGHP